MRCSWIDLMFASIAVFQGSGCSATSSMTCTTEARASLTVSVLGPASRICDAEVVADDGTEKTTLMPFGGPECTYSGPWEKAGSFTVTASKAGFQSASAMVAVGRDECHVIGQKVTLMLARGGAADGGP